MTNTWSSTSAASDSLVKSKPFIHIMTPEKLIEFDLFKRQPMHPNLNIDPATLTRLCHEHRIGRLALFGSQLKGTAGPNSDIDLLVEFQPDARPTLLDMAQIEIELSQALGGRKVDLRTPQDLSRYFRDEVVRTAEVQYVAG